MNLKEHCNHEYAFWSDDDIFECPDCHEIIGMTCLSCGGEGMVYEDDYKGDWINYVHDFITCPECHGRGWVKERSWQ